MKPTNQKTYFSNGNLLISGEYFVLLGAKALSVPLNFGQDLRVDTIENNKNNIQWQANELRKAWFRAEFNSKNLEIVSTTDQHKAKWLQMALKAMLSLQPKLFDENLSYQFTSNIDFNTKWGWGSSSSLLVNLARWAGLDPFELNRMVSAGSGYDIAASSSPSPIIFQIENGSQRIMPIAFNPNFKENIYFIYLGNKQSSESSIKDKLEAVIKKASLVSEISSLTEKMAGEKNIDHFMKYMREHENMLSKTLEMPKIKEMYFRDFAGEVKSLGAWGGDFAMVVSHLPETVVKQYFKNKNMNTFFCFSELIKSEI